MEKLTPLVSICIPVFNGGDLIHRALISATAQTYKNIEIIVADNASTDKTETVVRAYAAQDSRIKYFRNENNIGPLENFYKSFRLASGEFIQELSHDDWLSKNYIEECLKVFDLYPEAGLVQANLVDMVASISDSRPRFVKELNFNFKTIPSRRVFETSYRGITNLGLAGSMGRKKDFIETYQLMERMFDDPDYSDLYHLGYAFDSVTATHIMTKYQFAAFTNKTAFLKLSHSANSGREFKFNFENISGIIRYYQVVRRCNEYLYAYELKSYLSGFRVYYGVEVIVAIIVNLIKSRLVRNSLENLSDLKHFFKDYPTKEKIEVVLKLLPNLIFRLIRKMVREFRPKQKPRQNENYFLNQKGEAVI